MKRKRITGILSPEQFNQTVLEQPRLEYLGVFLPILPPIIARKDVERFLGGVVSPKALANADSEGSGPDLRILFGREVSYWTPALLKWLETKRGVKALKKPQV